MLQVLCKEQWIDCLTRLREARALILRDSESFHESATALEKVGQILSGTIRNGLSQYEKALTELAKGSRITEPEKISRVFEVVREARNMAVHDGVWARHLNTRLIGLFLILEDAIMKELLLVEDIMVRSPVVAEMWHMIAQARYNMLANSFSTLPVFMDGSWHLLRDEAIVRFLHVDSGTEVFGTRLSTPLAQAIDSGRIKLSKAVTCQPQEPKQALLAKMQSDPVLVVEESGATSRLVGIVSPFDLL